jgi:hypothetical protein
LTRGRLQNALHFFAALEDLSVGKPHGGQNTLGYRIDAERPII